MSAKGKGFSKTHKVDDAVKILFAKSQISRIIERIPTSNSLDRTLAEEIYSEVNLPGFRRSAMDGYAVIAKDTFGASETNPIQLRIIGSVEIGDVTAPTLTSGAVIRISTGAPVPQGATAVIQIEDCEMISTNLLEIANSVSTGKNIAKMDEDVKKGEKVYDKGVVLKPWDLAMLESIGETAINVLSMPRVSILSTGDELVDPGNIPQAGQVVDSNRAAINSWIQKLGVKIVCSKKCDDDPQIIKNILVDLAKQSDLIITTGGTSVGTRDYIPEIIKDLGELWVHGIAIRPGKPLALGKIDIKDSGKIRETTIISLPGYPLAAFINFDQFVCRLLSRWTKLPQPWQNTTKVRLTQRIPSKSGFRDFIRLKKTKDGAKLIRITGAGILSSLVHADYMLEIPEHIEGYAAGEVVTVKLLREDEI